MKNRLAAQFAAPLAAWLTFHYPQIWQLGLEAETAFNFVILSAVFGAKDLTRPDMRNPNYSVEGRCQRAFNRLKKEVVYFERAPK